MEKFGSSLGCFVSPDEQWTTICPLGTVKKSHLGYRKIQVLVDSGAAANVIPSGLLEDYDVIEGEAKRNGTVYMSADGGEIPNMGEQKVPFKTFEGFDGQVDFQVADVQRPLLSVTSMTGKGSRVEFDDHGGHIVSSDGKRRIRFHRRGGVYVLDLWVPPFQRQGQ